MSKRADPELYYLPGGKPNAGESAEECLRREVREELFAGIPAVRLLTEVRSRAALEPADLQMTVYSGQLDRDPRAGSEIASLLWWPDGAAVRLAPAVCDHVIPLLRAQGMLPS